MAQGGAEVVVLAQQDAEAVFPLGQRQEEPGVPIPGLPGLARLGQSLGGELAERLQQPVTAAASDLLTSRSTRSRAACSFPPQHTAAAAARPNPPANTDSARKPWRSSGSSSS